MADAGISPPVPTRALVTDVGNDIVYGYSVGQILAWVDEALNRLQRVTGTSSLRIFPLRAFNGCLKQSL